MANADQDEGWDNIQSGDMHLNQPAEDTTTVSLSRSPQHTGN